MAQDPRFHLLVKAKSQDGKETFYVFRTYHVDKAAETADSRKQ